MGAHQEYVVEARGTRLVARAVDSHRMRAGDRIWLVPPPDRCCVVLPGPEPPPRRGAQ